MIVSTLHIFVAIIATMVMNDYFNSGTFYYNDEYILKSFKLISVSILFSIIHNVSILYFDKRKIKKIIETFKPEYKSMSSGEDLEIINNMSDKAIYDNLREIKKRQSQNGKLRYLDIQSIIVIVNGINMKKMEYKVSCTSMYDSGRSENIFFNFYTINHGNIMLKHIDCPVNVGQCEVQ